MTTRRILTVLAVAVIALVAVGALREATENRPDRIPPGTASVITVSLRTNRTSLDQLDATAIWTNCLRSTLGADQQDSAQLAWHDDGTFTGTFTPALGEHGSRRLRGCLEDHRYDHLQASVTAMTSMPADTLPATRTAPRPPQVVR